MQVRRGVREDMESVEKAAIGEIWGVFPLLEIRALFPRITGFHELR